jgi:hypothetical protein
MNAIAYAYASPLKEDRHTSSFFSARVIRCLSVLNFSVLNTSNHCTNSTRMEATKATPTTVTPGDNMLAIDLADDAHGDSGARTLHMRSKAQSMCHIRTPGSECLSGLALCPNEGMPLDQAADAPDSSNGGAS